MQMLYIMSSSRGFQSGNLCSQSGELFVGQYICSFINGMKAQHTPLKEARIVFYGAGSSAVGVATMIAQLISKETGISFDEAKKVPSSL